MINPRNLRIPRRLIPYGMPYLEMFDVRCGTCNRVYSNMTVICYNVNPAIYDDEAVDQMAAHAAYPVQIIKFVDDEVICNCLADNMPSTGRMMVFYHAIELN